MHRALGHCLSTYTHQHLYLVIVQEDRLSKTGHRECRVCYRRQTPCSAQIAQRWPLRQANSRRIGPSHNLVVHCAETASSDVISLSHALIAPPPELRVCPFIVHDSLEGDTPALPGPERRLLQLTDAPGISILLDLPQQSSRGTSMHPWTGWRVSFRREKQAKWGLMQREMACRSL